MKALASKREPRSWSVYMLRCSDDSFYTGIAKDAEARLQKHNTGKGAAYTRTRRPTEMIHLEKRFTRSGALVREAAIKALPRSRKEDLVLGLDRPKRRSAPRSRKAKKMLKSRHAPTTSLVPASAPCARRPPAGKNLQARTSGAWPKEVVG